MAKISGFHCLLDKFKHRQFMGDTRNPESVVCPRTHPTSASLLSQPYYLVSILWIKVHALVPTVSPAFQPLERAKWICRAGF